MSTGGAPTGNKNAEKHGGESAVRDLVAGTPLRGPAREAELAVIDELDAQGRYELVRRNAVRLQACADLFWHAITGAAERQDLSELDKYIKRFGWLTGASLRAWAQVKEEEPENDAIVLDAIQAAKNGTD